jgi:hypothetical protein
VAVDSLGDMSRLAAYRVADVLDRYAVAGHETGAAVRHPS